MATVATTKIGCLITALSKRALNPFVSVFNVWFSISISTNVYEPASEKTFRKQKLSEQFEWRTVKLAASVEPMQFHPDEQWPIGNMLADTSQRTKQSR